MRSEAFSRLFVFVIGLAAVLALGTILPAALADGDGHEQEGPMAASSVPITVTAKESGCPSGKTLCFDLSEIRVKVGDTVVLTAVNPVANTGEHDVTIDEFSVHIHLHDPGDSDSQTFVADQAGTYTFYCSVLGHQAAGMEGSFIVEAEGSAGISTNLVILIVAVVGAVVVGTVVFMLWRRGRP